MNRSGTVYTETIVHLAPEAFAADVPYQVAIVKLDGDERVTARIVGERVQIGDAVSEVESVAGAPAFTKSTK